MQDNSEIVTFTLEPIGYLRSCFPDKFGIPRQSGLAPSAQGVIELIPPFDDPDIVAGLAGVSHIWVEFIFHKFNQDQWRPKIRPPRLGGNAKLGVFASRAPNRPNRLGLSVLKLDLVDCSNGVTLKVSGLDMVDGTPIVDIKPYLPYADCLPEAHNNIANEAPAKIAVEYSDRVLTFFSKRGSEGEQLKQLLQETLSLDPRPQYHNGKGHNGVDQTGREYGSLLSGFDVKWVYVLPEGEGALGKIVVTEIVEMPDRGPA